MNAEQAIEKFLRRFRSESVEDNVYIPKLRLASTVMPSDKPSFNEWAENIKKQNDEKYIRQVK